MRVTMIRHGQPDEVGHDDPPLTEQGRRQAASVMKTLQHARFDHVVCSPFQRARETAEPFLNATGMTPEIDPDLAEIDYGDPEYVRVEEARDRGDEVWETWKKRLVATVDEPAEAAFLSGIKSSMDRLAKDFDGKDVIIFAHGGVVNGMAAMATHAPRLWIVPPDYCGISRFEVRKGRISLKTLNEISHLEEGADYTAAHIMGG